MNNEYFYLLYVRINCGAKVQKKLHICKFFELKIKN